MNEDIFWVLDKEIKENMEKRHVFACLYNDSKLEDEKKYYKSKIDLIDSKVFAFLECQSLILKFR